MKKSELKSLIKEMTQQILSEDFQYAGTTSLGKKKLTLTIPVEFEILEKKYTKNGKLVEHSGDYELKYNREALDKSVKSAVTKSFENITKEKVTYSGASTLIGFPISFETKTSHAMRK